MAPMIEPGRGDGDDRTTRRRPSPPPVTSGGWDRFYADPSLVWPPETELEADPAPQERSAL